MRSQSATGCLQRSLSLPSLVSICTTLYLFFTLRKREVKTINQEYGYNPMFSGKRQTFATILKFLAVQHNNTVKLLTSNLKLSAI